MGDGLSFDEGTPAAGAVLEPAPAVGGDQDGQCGGGVGEDVMAGDHDVPAATVPVQLEDGRASIRVSLSRSAAVLGWERWREIGLRHGMGLVQSLVDYAVSVGRLAPQPVEPLAHVLMGALDEAALYMARADDPARARREVGAVIDHLVQSLAV